MFIEKLTYSFMVLSVSYMPIYVPIVIYGLRLFYKNYIVYRKFNMPIPGSLWSLLRFNSQICPVIEMCDSKLKIKNCEHEVYNFNLILDIF